MSRRLALLAILIASLGCQTPRRVRFESTPPGATVYLGSERVGATPLTTEILIPENKSSNPRRLRVVRVELEGYEAITRFISSADLPSKEYENEISWNLSPVRRTIHLELETVPAQAIVLIDGQEFEERTPCRIPYTVHRADRFEPFPQVEIRFRKDGHDDRTEIVDPNCLADNAQETVKVQLAKR